MSVSCEIFASGTQAASDMNRALRLAAPTSSFRCLLKEPESLPCDCFNFSNVLLYEQLNFLIIPSAFWSSLKLFLHTVSVWKLFVMLMSNNCSINKQYSVF